MELQLNLACERVAETGAGALKVSYRAHNDGSEALFLTHLMPGPPGVGFAPGVYVFHAGGGRALLLAGTPPPPPGVMLAWPGTPGATLLQPGEQIEASLALDLPLLEENAVSSPDAAAPAEPVAIEEVCLRLEYLPRRRGLEAREYQQFPGVWQVSGLPAQHTDAVVRLHRPAPMLRRTDDFFRP